MSILDNKKGNTMSGLKAMAIVTISCLLIAVIYNRFGHGVHSPYMDYMFLYPLILGVLFYSALIGISKSNEVRRFFFNVYNSGIVTLIVGSLLKGIFEIAGTSSPYITIYFIVGIGMIGVGTVACLIDYIKK